jgi:hypothetical protein
MEPAMTLARRLWQVTEPIHDLVYFQPEPTDVLKRMGLRGFWMCYFAGRFAPLGAIGPEPATAMAYGFAPWMVARALPDAWCRAAPEAVLAARVAAAGAVTRDVLATAPPAVVTELGDLLWSAVDACWYEGRPLAAGWSAVEPGDDPWTGLWLAATVLREHRGDGHVLAAVALGLRGLDATASHVATGAVTRAVMQRHRGWSDDEWDASMRRLQARGLLDRDGRLTKTGGALRYQLEETTDRLAAGPVERLGQLGVERVIELALPLSRHIFDRGIVPDPNPIGVSRP